MEIKRQRIQGAKWRRLDNTAKLFPGITSEDLSNVFRVSATLKEAVRPEVLETALRRVLPGLEGFMVKLRKGFFWYYFETNKRPARVEKENTYPCRFIDPHSNQLYLFRVSYYERRINLEVFHALTDGLGGINFLKELVYEYLRLCRQDGVPMGAAPSGGTGKSGAAHDVEDSYKRYYKKTKPSKYATHAALQLSGDYVPLDACSAIHGTAALADVKRAAAVYGVSVTKYLASVLIWAIFCEYKERCRRGEPIGINLPVNLRNLFSSETAANFFAVTLVTYRWQEGDDFADLVESVSRQMDENLERERLEKTISYNVANEKKLLLRLVPLPLKGMGMRAIFSRSSRAYTATLSNLGPVAVEEEFREDIEGIQAMIGVSRQQPFKCTVAAYEGRLVISFTSVFRDTALQRRFFELLKEQGVLAELEGNGMPEGDVPRGMYPQIPNDERKLLAAVSVLYTVMVLLALFLGLVNAVTYRQIPVRWSFITAACIAYVILTVRYSVLRNANLAFKLVVQSLGVQALLVTVDWITGYRGWSLNYAVPSVILFDVTAVAGLMIFNRLNWQSYFMYQLAITAFSFMPLLLVWLGWITRPYLAAVTAAVSLMFLMVTVILGDRSVKNELIRRFHI